LDRELGEKLAEKLSIEGINIYLPNSTEEILGDDKVNGIRINGGEIVPTDAILFSTGIRANLNLVKDSGIVYNRGIKVNECLETNVGNIYAAGDVAEIDDLIMGLWTASNEQGQVAGSNMSGVEKKYEIPKMFSTLNIGNIKVFSAGDIVNYDKVLEYKDESKDIHHKLFTRNGEMVGVILFGDLQGLNALRNGVFKHTKVEDYLAKGIQFK
jgi:nitrite reductase (NADH) large subunit